jgi:hypothetical protein
MITSVTTPSFHFNTEETKQILFKWTPRAIVIGVGAYYGLGIAYEIGLMAAIDKIAIGILKKSVGYAGIGALMPTVQWYSSLAVRFGMAAVASLSYDLSLRTASFIRYIARG